MASASDDFDLDSFLEQQSSDDDGSDLPGLNRSLEDILNDSEEESSSDSSEDDAEKRFLFRNPSFTHQRQENDENNVDWTDKAPKKTEKVEGHSSSFSIADRLKIGYDKGNAYDSDASNSNLEKNGKPLHSIESKDQKTEVDASGSNLEEKGKPLHSIDNLDQKIKNSNKVRSTGELAELRLSLSMKNSALWDFATKPSPFAASTSSSYSLLARSPAFTPLLGSVKPSPKPGAALAAAAAASRAVPSPHATAIKNRKANILSQKSLDSAGSGDSSSKIGAISEEEEKEESTAGSDVEISEGLFQLERNSTNMPYDFNLIRPEEEMEKGTYTLMEKQEEPLPTSNPEEFMARTETVTRENDEEIIISGKDEEIEGRIEPSTGGVPDNEVLELVQNDDKNSSTSDSEKSPPLVDSTGTQSSESSKISSISDPNLLQLGSEEETRNAAIQSPQPTETVTQEKQVNAIEEMPKKKNERTVDEVVDEKGGKVEYGRPGRKTSKKARASLKPLDLAEELEKRDASSGLHWEEGAAAQPMRLEGIRRGPPAIGHLQIDSMSYLSQALASQMFRRDHGSPQALAVHMNYIAVGMSKGSVLVNPNKYSSQSADSIDTKAFTLGFPGEKSQPAVASLCFNLQGDLLLVGYGNGSLILWELQRATAAKVITGDHSSAIVHTLFLGQDQQNARQFKVISGDSKGLVLLHTFSVVPLLRRYSVTSQCLLNGQHTGTVLCMSPLLAVESQISALNTGQGVSSLGPGGLGSMMGGVVGGVVGGDAGKKLFSDSPASEESWGVVIFVTQQTALVVRLIPNLEVFTKLSRPDGIREGAMPYTAWRRIPNQHGSGSRKNNSNSISNGNVDSSASSLPSVQEGAIARGSHDVEELDKTPVLAIAWDKKVQVAQLLKSELKVLREWNLDSEAQGVTWLEDQMLVVLTSKGQLCLFTKEGTELDRSRLPLEDVGGDSSVIYHTHFMNAFGNPEKAFHNSIAVRGAAIYLLGPTWLLRSRLLPWKERIQALQNAGDWMGALHMAMELYDGNAQGVIGLPRTLDALREAIMDFLLQLLSAYVDEAFSYISLAFSNQHEKLEAEVEGHSQKDSVSVQIKEQFARVGGVAIEFCVHIRRTDVLFDSVFSKFVGVQHGGTFLELLEPYILKDMLGCLPPEVMQALVEHYSKKGWLQRIEQCVLHMDIGSLDFNQVVRLCREHGLYSALIYLFNRGLDDFKAPLEELLAVAQDQQRPNAQAFGYKMLVYLKYCFLGLAFPPGHGYLPSDRLPSLRTELLQFLLGRMSAECSQYRTSSDVSSQAYPNLCYLLWLDTEATLEVLKCAFLEDGPFSVKGTNLSSLCPYGSNSEKGMLKSASMETNERKTSDNGLSLPQALINALTEILEMSFSGTVRLCNADRLNDKGYEKIWPSRKEIGNLLEFIACFVATRHASVSRAMLTRIMEYLSPKADLVIGDGLDGYSREILRRREKLMFALLKAVPESEWDSAYALELAQQAQFYQASSLIYMLKGQYIAALDSYIKDVGEPIYAFAFISNMLKQLADVNASTFADFRSAVLIRIPDLIQLSREATFLLVLEHFKIENEQIMSGLRPHPKSLFLYLKTIIGVHSNGILEYPTAPLEGNSEISLFGIRGLDQSRELQDYLDRISTLPELIRRDGIEVTDEMAELYLELLCQFEPKSVLKFLESFENYRLEHCLRLCQEYGVTDAAAFLLERVGDVGSALSLTIADVDVRIREMDSAVANAFVKSTSSITSEEKQLNVVLMMPEVEAVQAILHAAVGLCQRNTLRLDPQESEYLWFSLLDTFSEPSRKLYSYEKSLRDENGHCSESQMGQSVKSSLRWKVLEVGEAAYLLRKVFAHFIGEVIDGMVGYVPLPMIMGKLLSDNGSQEFGDFKATILGMLGTYGYERTILDTAKNLIEDDTYYNISMLKKGASHAYAPASSYCCKCGRALDKESFGSSICIFHCGHATHFQCETQDPKTPSKDSSAGCPICIPKKRSSARNKMTAVKDKNAKVPSNTKQIQALSAKSYENAMTERPYGLHQQSRFELLSSLQKGEKSLEVGLLPNLRLAPPLVYHDHKAHKSSHISKGETSNGKLKSSDLIVAQRTKGSLPFQFALTSSIFGTSKNRKH